MTVQTLKKLLFPNTGGMWNDALPAGERREGAKMPRHEEERKRKTSPFFFIGNKARVS